MSNAELPRSVDAHRLTENRVVLDGQVPLQALSRFSEAVLGIDPAAQCRVHLAFSSDGQRRRILAGELSAQVTVECQRCLSGMTVELTSRFELGLVMTEEQARQLPSDLEPFLMEESGTDLWALIEDELLLVLPPFPLHERNQCPATPELEALEPKAEQPEPAGERENPFNVLAALKKTTRH